MKRVLLLTYYFPPRVATGSLRATYLAKYLPSFGWHVTIVTPRFLVGEPPSWATVIETDYTDVIERVKQYSGVPKEMSTHAFFGADVPKVGSKLNIKQRFVDFSYKVLTFPDPQKGWFKPGVRAVASLLSEGSYNAVISTSYPYTPHLIAKRALARYKTPWVADLRDIWRGNHHVTGIGSALHSMLESKTLKRANAITTVSAPLAHHMTNNYPAIPTFEIRNAFDPEDWVNVPYRRPLKFTLTYAGSLYQGLRDPGPLFDALLDEFGAGTIQREWVEIVFYAEREQWLEESVKRRGLQDVVVIKGYHKRNDVLHAERATSANLILLWDHPDDTGVYTGKLFEYIGAGPPILTIGGPEQSVIRDLLTHIGGWYARSRSDIRIALRTLYQEHIGGSNLRLNLNGNPEFSAVTMAQRFGDLLDQLDRGKLASGTGASD